MSAKILNCSLKYIHFQRKYIYYLKEFYCIINKEIFLYNNYGNKLSNNI